MGPILLDSKDVCTFIDKILNGENNYFCIPLRVVFFTLISKFTLRNLSRAPIKLNKNISDELYYQCKQHCDNSVNILCL
jgi:hypothetical protein